MIKVTDPLLKEILEIWTEANFERQITSEINFREQGLWFNSLIRIANKPIFFKEWSEKGITKVKDLPMTGTNRFLPLNALASKYGIKPCPLGFYGLVSAVKSLRKTITSVDEIKNQNPETLCDRIMKSQRPGPLIYKKFIKANSLTPTNSQNKWLQDCNYLEEENPFNWKLAYLLAPSCTKSTKLIEFQFKFLHRCIPTNNFLFKIGRKENENCTFCHSASETLIHLFWSCHVTSSFWERIVDWLQENLLISSEYTLLNITALGLRPDPHPKHTLQLNYIYLLARYHIWNS